MAKLKGLGRGLDALLGGDEPVAPPAAASDTPRELAVDHLQPGKYQPRTRMDQDALKELAESIKTQGVIQPILVRPVADGKYEIIAGERRWRAARMAGLQAVPVVIRNIPDNQALAVALIENIQRSDLNALEEARAYALLLEQFSYTQQQLADSIGKSRSHIANTLRLMNLPEAVRAEIEQGRLTAGHARALVATDSPAELAAKIIKLGLSVREAENLAREAASPRKPRAKLEKDADTRALEKLVSEAIGLKLEITHKGDGSGTMLITYKTLDQLEDVCRRLQK